MVDMLITALTNAFFGGVSDTTSKRLVATPDEIVDKSSKTTVKMITPEKFRDDVDALKNYIGIENFKVGNIISVSLQELLTIIPKKRKRIDSYNSLVKYLSDERGITLDITSRKTKKGGKA